MNKIMLECFADAAETVCFEGGTGCDIEVIFCPSAEGYLRIGGINERLCDGRCVINLAPLTDGEHQMKLITANGSIALPPILKEGQRIRPKEFGESDLRRLSVRVRRLEAKIGALCQTVGALEKRIDGSKIF